MKPPENDPNHLPSAAVMSRENSSRLRRGKYLLLAVLGAGCLAMHAHADALTGHYTQVAVGDPDFSPGPNAGGTLANGMVQGQLGPDGLPVLSAAGVAALGTSSDMNPTTHELLWWSPGADPYVSQDAVPVQIDSMPMTFGYPNPWYPTGQTSDSNFYRSVHWDGTFDMTSPGPISLSLSVDDDAWLFIDGNLITEDHYGFTADSSPEMSEGVHSIDIFYDDRFPVYDSFSFTSSVPLDPVPEPGSIALSAAGALCLLAWKSKRQKSIPAKLRG